MGKKNILYFAPCGLDDGIGGSGRLKNMIKIFEILNFDIKLISYLSLERFNISKKEEKNLNSTVISFPNWLPSLLKIFAIPLIFGIGLLNSRGKDIIFAHAPHVASGFPGLLLSKLLKKPLIVDHMDIKDPATPQFVYDLILRHATTVFVISHNLEKEVMTKYSNSAIYMPIFVDTDFFKMNNDYRKEIRNKLKISSEEIVIGYLGSFWYVEGVPYLIESFDELKKIHSSIKLMIVGGGNATQSDDLKQIIRTKECYDDIILISRKPYELMPKYLSACDIVCSPKIYCKENIAANPIKIYEYMSMGLITVSSSVGEVKSVIENRKNGFLVEPENLDDLKKVLDDIIINIQLINKIGYNARNLIIENYSQKKFERKVNYYINLISTGD
jgi:glycosyltransferase involved in cell wall biosynthesis